MPQYWVSQHLVAPQPPMCLPIPLIYAANRMEMKWTGIGTINPSRSAHGTLITPEDQFLDAIGRIKHSPKTSKEVPSSVSLDWTIDVSSWTSESNFMGVQLACDAPSRVPGMIPFGTPFFMLCIRPVPTAMVQKTHIMLSKTRRGRQCLNWRKLQLGG